MSSPKKRVGFFGIAGSFTYKTATAYFTNNEEFVSTPTFRDIFVGVDSGQLDYGVIPIENTLAGSIYENYDLLEEYNLFVTGEVSARVSHCLLTAGSISKGKSPESLIKKLRQVYSHEKALEQCSNFFKEHPWIKPVAYTNTANAAKFVADKKDPTLGAIADGDNAQLYDLKIVRSAIENNKYNFTRFLIIRKSHSMPSNANKCSLLVYLPHVSGSLSDVLELLKKRDCNLTKIESRPIRTQPFVYVFYIDFYFKGTTLELDGLLKDLEPLVTDKRILGVYANKDTGISTSL